MSKATIADSDTHLVEVLQASKAKLNALNAEIQLAKEDNESFKKVAQDCENDMNAATNHTTELRDELKRMQEKNVDLATQSVDLKTAIQQAKQELATVIDEGERKYKEITAQVKKAQEEQKKIQLQYRDLQKDSDKLSREREKMDRLKENLDKKEEEIAAVKKELEEHQAKDNDRIQSLEEHTKIVQGLSNSPQ